MHSALPGRYDLLQGRDKSWKIILHYLPQDIEIYRIISMNQAISKTNDLFPWNTWILLLCRSRHSIRRFAYYL